MFKFMKTFQKKQTGYTLIEVLAAIVIISIILIGVVNLLNFTNKTAYSNNSKLVSINLALATIERIKIQPSDYFKQEDIVEIGKIYTYTSKNCPTGDEKCKSVYQLYVNDQHYEVELKVSQSNEEKMLNLINTVVTVKLNSNDERKIESTMEGYINLSRVNFENDVDVND